MSEIKKYPDQGIDINLVATDVSNWFKHQGYDAQILGAPNGGSVVQAKKSGLLRTALGVSSALTVAISKEDGNLVVETGASEWKKQVSGGAIGTILFPPALATTAYGAWTQSKLPEQVFQVVENHIKNNFLVTSDGATVLLTVQGVAEGMTNFGSDTRIDLTATEVIVTSYKFKTNWGLMPKKPEVDRTRIDKVKKIPRSEITEVTWASDSQQLVISYGKSKEKIKFKKYDEMEKLFAELDKTRYNEYIDANAKENERRAKKNFEKISLILERRGLSPDKVIISADGANGQIVLTDKGVIIGREGFWNQAMVGYTKGDKFLPYKNISSVQFKEPGMTYGYIQFTLPGGIENRGGAWDAASDENTVIFNLDMLERFRKIRSIVEERQFADVPTLQVPSSPRVSIADELSKLATLKRDGTISDEEYELLKKDLLSQK